jgi:hypothetical protein
MIVGSTKRFIFYLTNSKCLDIALIKAAHRYQLTFEYKKYHRYSRFWKPERKSLCIRFKSWILKIDYRQAI